MASKRRVVADPELLWKGRYDELNARVEPLRKESLGRLQELSTLRRQYEQLRVHRDGLLRELAEAKSEILTLRAKMTIARHGLVVADGR